jgi:hypothetical protein
MPKESLLKKFDFLDSIPKMLIFVLFISGASLLAWVGWITWNDISVWNKDLGTIFFGSRMTYEEPISLGIGMAVIHYFLIGVSLLAAGIVLFVRNHFVTTKLQAEIPKEAPIKQYKAKDPQKIVNVKQSVKIKTKEENALAQEERFFSGCLHHFGYLSTRPKESPIPHECILCQRLGDCMVATVYVKKTSD